MREMDTLRSVILVVEDDVDIAAILGDLLEDEGYSVLHARDGVSALEVLSRHYEQVGLILLDMLMPRMNGRDFRHHQQQDPSIAHIPVVIVTTGAEVDSTIRPTAFLRKPFSAEDLFALVERIVGSPHA